MDNEYSTFKDGKMITIPPINNLCDVLKEKFNGQEQTIERLKEENKKLKEGVWEKEEVARLKTKHDEMADSYYRGFPISKEEQEKIREWRANHKCPYRKMKIGGCCHYTFTPTGIGTVGEIVCSCGERFTFQELS